MRSADLVLVWPVFAVVPGGAMGPLFGWRYQERLASCRSGSRLAGDRLAMRAVRQSWTMDGRLLP